MTAAGAPRVPECRPGIYSLSFTVICAMAAGWACASQRPACPALHYWDGESCVQCPPGYVRRNRECVDPADAIVRYADCMRGTLARERVSHENDRKVQGALGVAVAEASVLHDVRERTEREIRILPQKDLYLDISSRCNDLAVAKQNGPLVYVLDSNLPERVYDSKRGSLNSADILASLGELGLYMRLDRDPTGATLFAGS